MPFTHAQPFECLQIVSVLMNSHERPTFVVEAIESVMAQTTPDWELLIIDHASQPAVVDTLTNYARRDDRIRILFSGRNLGNVVGTNVVSRLAQGKFLAFLDDDNRYKPSFLERMTRKLELGEGGFDAVVCESEVIRGDGRLTGATYSPKQFDRLREVNTIDHNEMMVRYKTWEREGGFDPDCFYLHDWEFALRLQRHGIGYVPERLVEYRVHDNRLSALTGKLACRYLCLDACRHYIKKKHRL